MGVMVDSKSSINDEATEATTSHAQLSSVHDNNVVPLNASRVTLTGYLKSNEVLKKEVLWSLTASSSHLSNRQAEQVSKVLPFLFDDSKYAQTFSVGKDKLSYFINHGIAPVLEEKLHKDILASQIFAVSYDESLNKIAQKTQMDIHIRYIDHETNLTKTSYLTSEFLLSSKADDLVLHLTNALSKFAGLQNLVSVAMDGPNVNWKMFADLKRKL